MILIGGVMAVLFAVVLSLQDLGPAKVEAWVKQLSSDDVAVRDDAEKRLLGCGEKVLPLLEKHAGVEDKEVRSRVAGIMERLRRWTLERVVGAAKEALKEGSKPEEWRPKLKQLVEKLLAELGHDAAAESVRDCRLSIAGSFAETHEVGRENEDRPVNRILLVDRAKGTRADRGVLLVCGSAEFENIDDSVLICLGDVRVTRELEQSVLIAAGKVEIGDDIQNSIVVCAGAFACGKDQRDSTIMALGGAKVAGRCKEGVWVNTPSVECPKREGDREVTNARLPSRRNRP